ncbi:hypothetical protein RN01_07195 [Cupriavidus sp. SHE]|jgi:hypothetical protein|uniref:Uncharacterized protein n=1 Tax=Cupriavidus metallidurans TaxID=119219 RepID=A0A482IT44_9BURK|nr:MULTISPECIES: hypothetical protein [Cupriavidus]KWR84285.1 hypothetical protein RN01_07195 [Cupriavidus sp. SHE]QBP09970.1 hypothetical protein DDF84_009450 [Cupriavidus metallidurans]
MTDAATQTPEIYAQGSAAIAVFDPATHRGLLAFGEQPGLPAGFIDVDEHGHATEYLPFEGMTRHVDVTIERTAHMLHVRIHRDGEAAATMMLQREQPISTSATDTIQGTYHGHVHALEEAGSVDVTVSYEGKFSCRIPGNCIVSGQISPTESPGRYALSVSLIGKRNSKPYGNAVPGDLISLGDRMMAVCRTETGGILYIGKRASA